MEDIVETQKELLELAIKAGRRCAYDLAHAASDIPPSHTKQIYEERANLWLSIFDPADGVKDYRNRLHKEISMLKSLINKYEKRLEEHNIDYSDIEMFPGM